MIKPSRSSSKPTPSKRDIATKQIVARIIDTVPGMTLNRVDRTGVLAPNRGYMPVLYINVDGWSPTLHERARTWQVNIAREDVKHEGGFTALTGSELAARIEFVLKDKLSAHREIAEAARHCGFTHSLGEPDPDAGRYTIGHLHIDLVTAEVLLARLTPDEAIREISRRVARLLAMNNNNENLLMSGGDLAMVHDNRPVFQMTELFKGKVSHRPGIVWVGQGIPETILEALIGRPIRALVETGISLLDNAIIEGIEDDNLSKSLAVRIANTSICIADHPVLGPALAALRGRTTPSAVTLAAQNKRKKP